MSMFRNDGGETPTDSLKGDWQPLSLSLDWKYKSREDLGIWTKVTGLPLLIRHVGSPSRGWNENWAEE